MFYLPNKFVLLANHKQLLKCARQNSYLDFDQIPYILLTRSSSFSKATG